MFTNIDKRARGFLKSGLLVLALMVISVGASYGTVSVLNSPDCKDLIAGQTIDAGDVCLEVVGENLVVTYTTTGGWELMEAHFWLGTSTSYMPQTKKGNPKIGNFPYQSGDITGQTSYAFTIPLEDLGGSNYAEDLCDVTYFAAAHAAVRKADGSGGYQTETGWASGDPNVPQGSWAMYFNFLFVCDFVPGTPGLECETAFALGEKKLWDILDMYGDPITNRWGWQITVYTGDSFTTPIYAGAGQNDITKGTHVGDLVVSYNGSLLEVYFYMFTPYTMAETHLYAGVVETDTAAPGLFGNLHDLAEGTDTEDYYAIAISGDPIYVVAHAVVCEPGSN
jgi:hypothetical protein